MQSPSQSTPPEIFVLSWPRGARPGSHKDNKRLAERAGVAIALALAHELEKEYYVLEEAAADGESCDYFLAKNLVNETSPPTDELAPVDYREGVRLEISGMILGDRTKMNERFKEKLRQITEGHEKDVNRDPTYASMTGRVVIVSCELAMVYYIHCL